MLLNRISSELTGFLRTCRKKRFIISHGLFYRKNLSGVDIKLTVTLWNKYGMTKCVLEGDPNRECSPGVTALLIGAQPREGLKARGMARAPLGRNCEAV